MNALILLEGDMKVVIAILIGIVVGAVSVLPFRLAQKKIRGVNPVYSGGLAAWFAVAIGLSFIMLAAGLVVCGFVARDLLVPFLAGEMGTFLVVVIVLGVRTSKRY